MFIQPWDAALDDDEWQTWIAEGQRLRPPERQW